METYFATEFQLEIPELPAILRTLPRAPLRIDGTRAICAYYGHRLTPAQSGTNYKTRDQTTSLKKLLQKRQRALSTLSYRLWPLSSKTLHWCAFSTSYRNPENRCKTYGVKFPGRQRIADALAFYSILKSTGHIQKKCTEAAVGPRRF